MLEKCDIWETEVEESYKNISASFTTEKVNDDMIFIFSVENVNNGYMLTKRMFADEFYATKLEPESHFKSIFAEMCKQVGGRLK